MPSTESTPFPFSFPAATSPFGMFAPAIDYAIDAAQRSILFWDVLRQRSEQYRAHMAETAPHVLDYEVELILDGRRPTGRTRPGHWRFQVRQRNRCRAQSRTPLLFHRVPAGAGAGTNH